MVQRLMDQYEIGTLVDILLRLADGEERWWPGQVVAHDFPGVWVKTEDGKRWFVTNRRRIRQRR